MEIQEVGVSTVLYTQIIRSRIIARRDQQSSLILKCVDLRHKTQPTNAPPSSPKNYTVLHNCTSITARFVPYGLIWVAKDA